MIRGPVRRAERYVPGAVCAVFALMICTSRSLAEPAAKPPLTVSDAIQTTRFMSDRRGPDPRTDGVMLSPDGKRYVVMLVRGDLSRGGNWVEFLAGGVENFEQASQPPRRIAQLFLSSLGESDPVLGVPALTWPRRNPPRWLPDKQRIAFNWPQDGVVQVATLHVDTGEFQFLTQQPRHVLAFDFNSSGQLLYSGLMTHSRERSGQMLRQGFKVEADNILDLLNGDVGGYGALDRANDAQWFVRSDLTPGGTATRVRFDEVEVDRSGPQFQPLFSPDGSRVLVDHFPAQIPEAWRRYEDTVHAVRMAAYSVDPKAIHVRQLKQLFVVDLAGGRGRPLWPAPAGRGTQAAWSADARAVLLGPVFLPLEADGASDEAGLTGRAIAEVDVASGRYRQVQVPVEYAAESVRGLRWLSASRIEVVQQTRTLRFERSAGRWKLQKVQPAERALPPATVHMEWRQDLNTPPVLYAVNADGRAVAVLDPNPDLQRFALGRVEMIAWQDKQGRRLRGRLYHPVGVANERAPLVIQTHGYAPANEFSLYGYGAGPGLGPGFSTYAAQPLAGRGIAVLQVADPTVRASAQEADEQMSTYESAIEHLAERGLIDSSRVGLLGFSRSGWYVLHALTHSKFPYAAALVSDNFDAGYMQASLTGWNPEITRDIGAEPFGEGLQTWIERSPALAVERLSAPLRMQIESGGRVQILAAWEFYSRARRVGKTVELYVIPDVEHGSHGIQNPAQCMASQQGAVEWFDSWLRRSRL